MEQVLYTTLFDQSIVINNNSYKWDILFLNKKCDFLLAWLWNDTKKNELNIIDSVIKDAYTM